MVITRDQTDRINANAGDQANRPGASGGALPPPNPVPAPDQNVENRNNVERDIIVRQ